MPHSRFDWLTRLKAVEREFGAVRQATARFREQARIDPAILRDEIRPRDIKGAWERLEGTYVIRLFAEFETGLRLFWASLRTTRPTIRNMIESVGDLRGIPTDDIRNAHRVREYRNALVHEREDDAGEVPISDCRGYLCRYFGRLPDEW